MPTPPAPSTSVQAETLSHLRCHSTSDLRRDEQQRLNLLPFLLDLKVFFPLLYSQRLPLFRGGLIAVVVQQEGPHLPTDGNINPTEENGLEEGAKVMTGSVLTFPKTATRNCLLGGFAVLS